jgi:hypothetical protein
MNEQQQAVPVQLNGGVYPEESGSWRVVVWLSGIRGETEAHRISGWLNGMLQANMSKEPPPPQQQEGNGAQPPRPDPSVPFAKS